MLTKDDQYINVLVETIQDQDNEKDDQTLRGATPVAVNITPTVESSKTLNVPTTADSSSSGYQTRSSTRASRLRWDHRTYQLLGAEDRVMLVSVYKEKYIDHSSFNICNVKKAIKSISNEAVKSIYMRN